MASSSVRTEAMDSPSSAWTLTWISFPSMARAWLTVNFKLSSLRKLSGPAVARVAGEFREEYTCGVACDTAKRFSRILEACAAYLDLMEEARKILALSVSGPSSPWRVGVESATREIEKAADLCLQKAGATRNGVVALGAGLAGTGKPELKEGMKASLAGAFPAAAVSVFTDLEMALAAAGEGPVIVLVAGTGSAAIGRNAQGQIWRTGGQGPRLGDDGSAFDIGSRAVARAMKERDQRGKDSILGMKILEQLDYASWPELQER